MKIVICVYAFNWIKIPLGYGMLYNFMLEEMEDYGPANVAKFARYVTMFHAALWWISNASV